jgi:hypothetical protein
MKKPLPVASMTLVAVFVVLAVCLVRTTSILRVVWYVPGDTTYWNGFLNDHLNMWLALGLSVLTVGLLIPGLELLRRWIKRPVKRRKEKGQLWKTNGDWGEWR